MTDKRADSVNEQDGRTYVTVPLAVLFAIASGLAVGNLYWAQPLLADIAREFGVVTSETGVLVTVTLVGYAIGVLFVAPLGDVLSRKFLIPLVMGASALAVLLWNAGAWTAIAIGGAVIALCALATWFIGIRTK